MKHAVLSLNRLLGRLSVWLFLSLSLVSAAADEALRLRAQLVWATNGEKPAVDPNNKDKDCIQELDEKVGGKLKRVFKWRNYYQIKEENVSPPSRVKLSSKCEVEIKKVDDATLEVKLYGEGKLTTTKKQPIKPLTQGEILVVGGDDKAKYDDAWFVVLSVAAR